MIDDSFNSTFDSICSTLKLLNLEVPVMNGKRIAVLGNILHLADAAEAMHRDLLGKVLESKVDLVFTFGNHMKLSFDRPPPEKKGGHAETHEELTALINSQLRDGDVLTLKASRPMGMNIVAKSLRRGE